MLPQSQGYAASNNYQMSSQEYRQRLLERHLSSQNRAATSPVDSIPSVEYNSPRYSSPYETYAARESLIDPESASVEYENFESAMPRDTYIEPNMSRIRETTVQPMSISMYSDYHYLDPAATDMYSYHHSRVPASPLDQASRGEYFNDNEMVDPQIRALTPPMPPVIQQNHHHQAVVHHSFVPVPSPSKAVIDHQQGYFDDSESQLSPNPRPSAASRHPQPLPPLVIPPSPVRSISTPDSQWQAASPRSSSLYNDSPRQMIPTPNTAGSSPRHRLNMHNMAPSPQPSPSTAGSSPLGPTSLPPSPFPVLSPSKSTPTGGAVDKKKNATKKKESVVGSQAEQLVYAGIKFHEAGQLEKAAENFKLAAEQSSPLGMFLYGVSLRHGWGCKKNEKTAFQYLQKAAESAVLDLNNLSSTVNMSAARGELVMAIYELGVSFRHGWGCAKDKASAVYFFKIAADLGDPDAQNDLGHCYYHGQGVKKDLHKAAKYYRKAAKQGQGIMGNSWIFKSKYDPKN